MPTNLPAGVPIIPIAREMSVEFGEESAGEVVAYAHDGVSSYYHVAITSHAATPVWIAEEEVREASVKT